MDAVTSRYGGEVLQERGRAGDPWQGVDAAALAQAVRAQAGRPVTGIDDMASYLARQVSDASHREVLGPLLDGQGASGVVVRRGAVLASWGDPARAEMAYSATKSVLSLVAGIAFDDGALRLDEKDQEPNPPVRAGISVSSGQHLPAIRPATGADLDELQVRAISREAGCTASARRAGSSASPSSMAPRST
ncbi:hypothetical protein [Streptomyces sp. NPDC057301]|uniref:hypothetical protein n=1 Tax=Streptomyces sp. NPDC057301 TaxID=3346093 RepID=UPI003636F0B1